MPTLNQYQGCLLGLALGDALGAPHEGGFLERMAWKLLGTTPNGERRFTDDTQMSLNVADTLIEKGEIDQDRLAERFAADYEFTRGYGPGAARLLKRIASGESWRDANRAIYANGSYGNGAAMRAPVVGLFYPKVDDTLFDAVCRSAEITHAHPLGIEGAQLVATATVLSLEGLSGVEIVNRCSTVAESEEFRAKISTAREWIEGEVDVSSGDVQRELGNGISALESCVTAIWLALRSRERDFGELMQFAIDLRGDVDTIASMAGAIWGARRGISELPADALDRLESRGRLEATAEALHSAAGDSGH
ncbi:MAG: ADP-ribosylglycohydrolase family protein [Planctomycetota bacterium]